MKYELFYIVAPSHTEKELPEINQKMKDFLSQFGAQNLEEKILGEKKFAYPIKKLSQGFYLLINFEVEPAKVKEINDKLKQMPNIVRHLITKK
jgi:small subunit ribosomal protein S6